MPGSLAIGLTSIHDIISHPEKAKMETLVRTPQAVFMQPQRLVVPLFQRPSVWNEENQWAPLWKDMARMAEKLVAKPGMKHHPHFLGAVVLQQVQNASGSIQERIIIDGQQRLTAALPRKVGWTGSHSRPVLHRIGYTGIHKVLVEVAVKNLNRSGTGRHYLPFGDRPRVGLGVIQVGSNE
jgi:hypothetical protein